MKPLKMVDFQGPTLYLPQDITSNSLVGKKTMLIPKEKKMTCSNLMSLSQKDLNRYMGLSENVGLIFPMK